MLLLWYAPPFGNGTPAPLYQFASITRPPMVDDDDDAIMLLWWQMMTSPEQE